MTDLGLTNILLQLVSLLQLDAAPDSAWCIYSAAKQRAGKAALRVAVDPASQTCFGSLGNFGLIFCGSGEHIHITELIIERIHRIHAVDKHLHLSAHLIIVDGRSPEHHIGFEHFLHDGVGIVVDYTLAQFLASKTTFTKTYTLATERDFFHFIASRLSALDKFIGKHVAV